MILRDNSRGSHAGLTRTEVVFSIVGVVIVAVLLTAFGLKTNQQNDFARCNYNLKQVGLAFILSRDENDWNNLPWRTPMDQGGTLSTNGSPQRNECWFHMILLSNQLRSPKVFVDPADKRARIAKTWDANPGSGLAAVRYRDQACSYAIALDYVGAITYSGPLPDHDPNSALFLDKHLDGKSSPEQCELAQIASTGFQKPFDLWWKPELHGPDLGNVALIDGSVEPKSESMMEHLLRSNIDLSSPNGSTHVLFPKRK